MAIRAAFTFISKVVVRDAVLGEHEAEGAEGRGLDRVDARFEELPVHLGDQIGPGEHEVLVATFELGAAEVVLGQILALDPGSEGTVEDEDTGFESSQKIGHQG